MGVAVGQQVSSSPARMAGSCCWCPAPVSLGPAVYCYCSLLLSSALVTHYTGTTETSSWLGDCHIYNHLHHFVMEASVHVVSQINKGGDRMMENLWKWKFAFLCNTLSIVQNLNHSWNKLISTEHLLSSSRSRSSLIFPFQYC